MIPDSDPPPRPPPSIPTALPAAVIAAALLFVAIAVASAPLPAPALLSPLLGAAMLLAAIGYGSALIARVPPLAAELAGRERLAPALIFGLALLSTAALAMGALGWLRAWAAVPVVAVGAVAGVRAVLAAGAGPREPAPAPGSLQVSIVALVLAPVLVTALLAGLPPPSWFDALEYHLLLPARYAIEGGLVNLPDNLFGQLPHGLDLVDALLLAVWRETRPASFHLGIGIAMLALAARIAHRLHPGAGALAAALLLLWREATSSFATGDGADLAASAAGLLALDLLLGSRRRPELLPWSFAAAGIVLSIKPSSLAFLPVLPLGAVLLRRDLLRAAEGRRRGLRALALLALPLLPWVLWSTLRHGQPGYPLVDLGGDPELGAWSRWIRDCTRAQAMDGGDPLRLPAALLGSLFEVQRWLPLPLAALLLPHLGLGRAARELGLLAALLLVCWEASAAVERYGFTFIAALAALSGAALAALLARMANPTLRRAAGAAVLAALVAAAGHGVASLIRARDFTAYLVGSESDLSYRTRLTDQSPAAILDAANQVLPHEAFVLSLDEPRLYGLWRRFDAATIFDRRVLRRFRRPGDSPAEVASRMRAAGFTHLLTHPAFLDSQLPAIRSPYPYDADERRLIETLLATEVDLVVAAGGGRLFALRPAPGER